MKGNRLQISETKKDIAFMLSRMSQISKENLRVK
jgi:hypothetical protein